MKSIFRLLGGNILLHCPGHIVLLPALPPTTPVLHLSVRDFGLG